jgi:hypothetical protein
MRKEVGDQVNQIVNPTNKWSKSNVYCLLVNTIFHPQFRDRFADINNNFGQGDFESGNGSNNHRLYADIASFISDPTASDIQEIYPINDNEFYDKHVDDALDSSFNLDSTRPTLDGKAANQMSNNLMKVSDKMQANMTESGEHSNDPHNFAAVAVKKLSLSLEMKPFVAYYFYRVASEHPTVINAIRRNMPGSMKADSFSTSASNDSSSGGRSGSSTAKKADTNRFIAAAAGGYFDTKAREDEGDAKAKSIQQRNNLAKSIFEMKKEMIKAFKEYNSEEDPEAKEMYHELYMDIKGRFERMKRDLAELDSKPAARSEPSKRRRRTPTTATPRPTRSTPVVAPAAAAVPIPRERELENEGNSDADADHTSHAFFQSPDNSDEDM